MKLILHILSGALKATTFKVLDRSNKDFVKIGIASSFSDLFKVDGSGVVTVAGSLAGLTDQDSLTIYVIVRDRSGFNVTVTIVITINSKYSLISISQTLIQSNLDISNSDISNSANFEASV